MSNGFKGAKRRGMAPGIPRDGDGDGWEALYHRGMRGFSAEEAKRFDALDDALHRFGSSMSLMVGGQDKVDALVEMIYRRRSQEVEGLDPSSVAQHFIAMAAYLEALVLLAHDGDLILRRHRDQVKKDKEDAAREAAHAKASAGLAADTLRSLASLCERRAEQVEIGDLKTKPKAEAKP